MGEAGRMEEIIVEVRVLPHHDGLPMPSYATVHSSGMDLHAAVERAVLIEPGQRELIPTGLCLAIPPGVEGQVRPRSGLAMEHGVTVLNAPGTVDADYRGEVKVLLVNLGSLPYQVSRGDRIAQLVFSGNVLRGVMRVQETLGTTDRDDGGFGHSGS
ncbi:MAG: dUTP diphosphatase [Thermodesulfobacteriota bacterium]